MTEKRKTGNKKRQLKRWSPHLINQATQQYTTAYT